MCFKTLGTQRKMCFWKPEVAIDRKTLRTQANNKDCWWKSVIWSYHFLKAQVRYIWKIVRHLKKNKRFVNRLVHFKGTFAKLSCVFCTGYGPSQIVSKVYCFFFRKLPAGPPQNKESPRQVFLCKTYFLDFFDGVTVQDLSRLVRIVWLLIIWKTSKTKQTAFFHSKQKSIKNRHSMLKWK